MFRRLLLGGFRVTVAVVAAFLFLWWFGVKMPGKNISSAAPLSSAEIKLRDELIADVRILGAENRRAIGAETCWSHACELTRSSSETAKRRKQKARSTSE